MQWQKLSHKNYKFYKIYKRKLVKIKNLQSNKNLSCVIFHPLQKPALCPHNASAASPLTVGSVLQDGKIIHVFFPHVFSMEMSAAWGQFTLLSTTSSPCTQYCHFNLHIFSIRNRQKKQLISTKNIGQGLVIIMMTLKMMRTVMAMKAMMAMMTMMATW